tara:strand:+ start:415 stop:855 length:441 start_codon:yes stop_codon:yes gene_type:complete
MNDLLESVWHNNMNMRIIIQSCYPFLITDVSSDWLNFCGLTPNKVLGKTLKIIQGECTELIKKKEIMNAVHENKQISTTITNYTNSGIIFKNEITIIPNISNNEFIVKTTNIKINKSTINDSFCPNIINNMFNKSYNKKWRTLIKI